mmetsp:Transcript_61301/g.150847  ORF Transcript_61301/g.150847 Transcript_61301/m.150847 type:complete len:133 (-) Transcript_61301:1542-1940(-)
MRRSADQGSKVAEKQLQTLREDAHAAMSTSVDDAEAVANLRDVRVHAQDYPGVDMGSQVSNSNHVRPELRKVPSASALGQLEVDEKEQSSRQEVRELKAHFSAVHDRVGVVEHKVDALVRKLDLVLVKLNTL